MEAPHKYHLARKPTKLACVVECLVRTTPGTPTIQRSGEEDHLEDPEIDGSIVLK